MPGADARMLAAASVTTVLSTDWKPATRTLSAPQSADRGELVLRRLDPAEDLRRPLRQQLTGRRQSDAAPGALRQRKPHLRLES